MARDFNSATTAVISTSRMATRFDNMLTKVNNLMNSQNTYAVWIRLVIGKSPSTQIIFDTSSKEKDENLMLSLDYEKCGAGTGNKFTFKVAFDLFNYGQETKKNVELLDNLLYNAMNIVGFENVKDELYCKFQYGYSVVGNTQIVSPLYEGLITEILPSINYSNGKTSYTISGFSMISSLGGGIPYTYDEIGNPETKDGRWNGMDLVLWILWYYHGNEATVSELPQDYSGNINNRHPDVLNGVSAKLNIDIPSELMTSASLVYVPAMQDMTPIDYCKEVLNRIVNTSDSRYNGNDLNPDYELENDSDFRPYYTLYITDSGGSGVSTVHIAYISTKADETKNMPDINFKFSWFNKKNGIVVGWQPNVTVMTYLLARAQNEHDLLALAAEEQEQLAANEKEMEDSLKELEKFEPVQDPIYGPQLPSATGTNIRFNRPVLTPSWNRLTFGTINRDDTKIPIPSSKYNELVANITNLKESNDRTISATYDAKRKELANITNFEFYKAKLTLVGIPSDIPVGAILHIQPRILESVSRTQGKYFIAKSKDSINSNGLFLTTIELSRLSD